MCSLICQAPFVHAITLEEGSKHNKQKIIKHSIKVLITVYNRIWCTFMYSSGFSQRLFQLQDATQLRRCSQDVYPDHNWKLSWNKAFIIFG